MRFLLIVLIVCTIQPPGYADTFPVILIGQLAPGTEGGRFSSLGPPAVNASGTIVFRAGYEGGGFGHEGVFELADGNLAPIAREGDPVPDFPGVTFLHVGNPQINDSGDVAFATTLSGAGTGLQAIIMRSAGTLRKIVDNTTEFGSINNTDIQFNEAGDIAFLAASGIYLASGGTVRKIATKGQPLPGSNEVYQGSNFAMNNHRDFVLNTDENRLVLLSEGSVTLVAHSEYPDQPSINDAKDIVFVTRTLIQQPRGPYFLSPTGIVRWSNGSLETVAKSGDPVPGFPGATFASGAFGRPQIDDFGGIVFRGWMNFSGETSYVIASREGGNLKVLARSGDFFDGLGTTTDVGPPNQNERKGIVTFVSSMSAAAPVSAAIFVADTQPCQLLFPQIADGNDAGGNWRTTLVLANRSTTTVSATVSFYDDAGAPMRLSVTGQQAGVIPLQQSQIPVEIPPLGITRLQTDGTGTLKTGWVAVQASQRLSGVASFGFFDAGNRLINEVGASAIVPLRSMSVFVETGATTSTGIAIANPNATGDPAAVTLILRDSNSNEVARTSLSILPNGHLARYASELFPSVSLTALGKIEIISSRPVIALTLRQRDTVFTSLPVIP